MKIVPSVSEVVRNLARTFDEVIVPVLQGSREKSTAQTMGHLFRYIELTIEYEGQLLLDEVFKLENLLDQVASHFESLGGSREAGADRAELATTIRRSRDELQDPHVYPSLTRMGDRIAELRSHVCEALTILNRMEKNADDEALHELLRDYIRWQIEQEGKVIQPAFWGHGPRR